MSTDRGFKVNSSVRKIYNSGWESDPHPWISRPMLIPAGGGLGVAFFATGLGWALKDVYLSGTRIYLTLKNLSVNMKVAIIMVLWK